MSSDSTFNDISASDMGMIKSVLGRAGYDANLLAADQPLFNAAALFVMTLVRAGETSPFALAAQLERNFGRATAKVVPFKSPLPSYAIQGLPFSFRKLQRASPIPLHARSKDADLQVWENEGGA